MSQRGESSPQRDATRTEDDGACWIFGYGSLVWRPDFSFVERQAGFIEGWCRRFWQGSTDHRGLPEAPGRVATLVRRADARCWGTAYRVSQEEREPVLSRLDHRERGGFERHDVTVHIPGAGPAAGEVGGHSTAVEQLRERLNPTTRLRALAYVATPENRNYLGPAPIQAIAEQVRRCSGPSGSNREYVLRLAEALRAMGASDDHVFALAERLE